MPLTVELVAADRKVWDGEAQRVIARTTDGDPAWLPFVGLIGAATYVYGIADGYLTGKKKG